MGKKGGNTSKISLTALANGTYLSASWNGKKKSRNDTKLSKDSKTVIIWALLVH